MSQIKSIKAREILNSRAEPTVEVDLFTKDGVFRSAVPAGASTGAAEAIELRDGGKRFWGKGVRKAVQNINEIMAPKIIGRNVLEQKEIDDLLLELDGTNNKSNLGANAILAVSMACCQAGAMASKLELYEYFGSLIGNQEFSLPQPMILILEGGKHGNWSTDVQEYMVVPKKEAFVDFSERLRVGAEIFHYLGKLLEEKNFYTGVGMEGAYCPLELKSNEHPFELMLAAIEKAGYEPGKEIVLAIDVAASEFYNQGKYYLKSEGGLELESRQWTEKLSEWVKKYPLWSIEDGHYEDDWQEWVFFNQRHGGKVQIVGDDLLTTNVLRIQKAIDLKAVNSVLIKPNQIGTISETLSAIRLAHNNGLTTVISHRSGETNDDLIADLTVGSGSWQSKFGGPDRGERVAKYNRLLRIEEFKARKGRK